MRYIHQLFILLCIAALIALSSHWPQSRAREGSRYFWAEGEVIRRGSEAGEGGIPLQGELACADIPAPAARFFDLALPINQADHLSLTALPGIGPKLADNILTYRQEHGSFAGPQDLLKVQGIGPKRSQQILPLLCFAMPQ